MQFSKIQHGGRRHFENSLSPYLSRELSDFDQIWYADASFHSVDGYLTEIVIFQIQGG